MANIIAMNGYMVTQPSKGPVHNVGMNKYVTSVHAYAYMQHVRVSMQTGSHSCSLTHSLVRSLTHSHTVLHTRTHHINQHTIVLKGTFTRHF